MGMRVSSDTFFCDMFPLLLPNRCCLGENNHKSQSVIEFLLCVAGIKEYKSDTFRVTDRTTFYLTFYEMVALRIGFKLLLTYANCVCNRRSTK